MNNTKLILVISETDELETLDKQAEKVTHDEASLEIPIQNWYTVKYECSLFVEVFVYSQVSHFNFMLI